MYAGSQLVPTNGVQGGGAQNFRGMGVGGLRGGAGATSGEILSVDDKSITLKLRDGGSKIVFFSSSTTISKMVDAVVADLLVGKTVSVQGTANPDGSETAQSIQIRPAIVPGSLTTGAAASTTKPVAAVSASVGN